MVAMALIASISGVGDGLTCAPPILATDSGDNSCTIVEQW